MQRIHSIEEFNELRQRLTDSINPHIPIIVISAGTCGQASGANDLIRITKRELLAKQLTDKIHLRITGCHGFCQMEPSILIEPQNTFYPKVRIRDMLRIVDAVSHGEVLDKLLYEDPVTGQRIEKQCDVPFFRKQIRTLLSRNEKVDPIRIYDYIQNGGYSALIRVLSNGDPKWALEEVKVSG